MRRKRGDERRARFRLDLDLEDFARLELVLW
jgi:hypothetical protein